MNQVTASEKLWVQRSGEEPFEVEIQIGTPYQVGTDPEEWACPVSAAPLYKRLHDAHGGSAFQALCLAASLVLDLLSGVKGKGGLVLQEPGEDFPLEAYAFGVATRQRST